MKKIITTFFILFPSLIFAYEKGLDMGKYEVDYVDFYDETKAEKVCKLVHDACRESGFIIIKNTALTTKEINAVYKESQYFFEQPNAEKKKILGKGCNYQRGYCPLRVERAKDHFLGDHRESFTGGVYPSKKYPELWPERKPFSLIMKSVSDKLMQLSKEVLELMALGASLEKESFSKYFKKETPSMFRSIHYPAFSLCPKNRIWAAEHTDITLVTAVLSPRIKGLNGNFVQGLEVQDKAGNWTVLTTPKNSVIIRVGDLLQNMTNGYFVSAKCRARVPMGSCDLERYVFVLYCHPPGETDLTPWPCMVAKTGGKKFYPKATRDELLSERLIDINFGDEKLIASVAASGLLKRMKKYKIASPRVLKEVKSYKRRIKAKHKL